MKPTLERAAHFREDFGVNAPETKRRTAM